MVRSPAKRLMLTRKIRRLQSENPDLHDIYEKKLAATPSPGSAPVRVSGASSRLFL